MPPILKFKETPMNRDCLHHRIRMIGVAVCPYCNEPSLEEVQRTKRRRIYAATIGVLVLWLIYLTWRTMP